MKATKNAFVLGLALFLGGCSAPVSEPASSEGRSGGSADSSPGGSREAASPVEEALPPPGYESALPEDVRSLVEQTFTGDIDAMAKRRIIRAGVPFDRSFYFIDKGVQRGL